jgi:CO dehydrogenase/acetyl-CoA synthase beta subunit
MAVHQHQIALNIPKTKGRGWQSRSYGFLSRMGYTFNVINGDVNWTIQTINFWWVPVNFPTKPHRSIHPGSVSG